jgi:hypothetical protein
MCVLCNTNNNSGLLGNVSDILLLFALQVNLLHMVPVANGNGRNNPLGLLLPC